MKWHFLCVCRNNSGAYARCRSGSGCRRSDVVNRHRLHETVWSTTVLLHYHSCRFVNIKFCLLVV